MVDLAVERHRVRPRLLTVLTLIVTPSALMIFTRGDRKRRGWFSRLFRRGKAEKAAPDANPVPVIGDEPVTAFPKAAE
jgi:multidrug efflux pump